MAGMGGIILYIIFLGALVYFMAIRPQKKERQKQQELLASVAVGDTILTSSGFYGVIIESLRVFGIPFYVNKERNHDQKYRI